MLFAYFTEQVCPPHCEYRSHCLHYVLAYKFDTVTHICQNTTNYNILHILLPYMCQNQICMPNCIYMSYMAYTYVGMYVQICATYEVIGFSHVTRNAALIFSKVHLIFLACITDKIWLPYCKHRSHYPPSSFVYRSNTGAYMCQNTTNYKIYFTCSCHICARNKYGHQTANINNKCKTFDR